MNEKRTFSLTWNVFAECQIFNLTNLKRKFRGLESAWQRLQSGRLDIFRQCKKSWTYIGLFSVCFTVFPTN